MVNKYFGFVAAGLLYLSAAVPPRAIALPSPRDREPPAVNPFEPLERSPIPLERLSREHSASVNRLQRELLNHKRKGDRFSQADILQQISGVLSDGGLEEHALALNRQALAIYQRLEKKGKRKDLPFTWSKVNALIGMGKLLERQNQPGLSVVFYKEALNNSGPLRRKPNLLSEEQKQELIDTHRSLITLFFSQARLPEAHEVLELLKEEELSSYTNSRSGDSASTSTATIPTNSTEQKILSSHDSSIALGLEIADCQETQCANMSQLLDERDRTSQEYNETVGELDEEIQNRRAGDEAFFDPRKLAREGEAIVAARPNTVLLYPFVLEDKIWLLWSAAGGITESMEVPAVGRGAAGTNGAAISATARQSLLQRPAGKSEGQATLRLVDSPIPGARTRIQQNRKSGLRPG